jgi:hypothetical protein
MRLAWALYQALPITENQAPPSTERHCNSRPMLTFKASQQVKAPGSSVSGLWLVAWGTVIWDLQVQFTVQRSAAKRRKAAW